MKEVYVKLHDAVVIIERTDYAFIIRLPLPNGTAILLGTRPLIVDAGCEIPRGKISEGAFEPLEGLRKAEGVLRIGIFPKALFIEKGDSKGDSAFLRLIIKAMKKICFGKKIAFIAVHETVGEGEAYGGEISGFALFALQMSWHAAIWAGRMPSSFKERLFWGDLYLGP
jgi:hypothetical protein